MNSSIHIISVKVFFICSFAFIFPFFAIFSELIDLEHDAQDFVLETKKIDIPDFPDAFNAAIIRWKGSLLMSFRVIPNPLSSFQSYLGMIWLNEDFTPLGDPQLLDLRPFSPVPSRAEDARLINVGEKLYIIYSDNTERQISKGGYRVYIGELQQQDQRFVVRNPECLSIFEGESKDLREKNWVPFDYHGTLLLAYSLLPHRIFRPFISGTGECETLFSTPSHLNWSWGEPRGGTPGLLVQDSSYLSFFHSSIYLPTQHSKGKNITHYFIGAYLFSSQPPFAITHISPKPIVGKNFYEGEIYKPYWKPIRAVFPCGFIFDEHSIWLTYGRQDHEIWVVKLDKAKLLDYLIPVQ